MNKYEIISLGLWGMAKLFEGRFYPHITFQLELHAVVKQSFMKWFFVGKMFGHKKIP